MSAASVVVSLRETNFLSRSERATLHCGGRMQSSVVRALRLGNSGGMPGAVTGSPRIDAGGDVLVEIEEMLEDVAFGGEAVGGENGGAERGVFSPPGR